MCESLINMLAAIIPVTQAPAYGLDENKERDGGFVIFHHLMALEHTGQLRLTTQVVHSFHSAPPKIHKYPST